MSLDRYEVETNAPVGPAQTRVLEYEFVERDDELTYVKHRSVLRMLDASFGDRYQIEVSVSLSNEGRGGVRYTRTCGVHFFERVPMFGIERLIARVAIAKNRAAAAGFLCVVKEALKTSPRNRARSELHERWLANAKMLPKHAPPASTPPPGPGGASTSPEETKEAPAARAPTVVLSGILKKSGRRSFSAHSRKCQLTEDGVLIYAKEGAGPDGEDHVLGSASVKGATIDAKPELCEFKLTRANGNWWRFAAKNEHDCSQWVDALKRAAADDGAYLVTGDHGVHGVRRRYSSSASEYQHLLPSGPIAQ